mgnify:CR=1 FL=1|jgi:hypothetical protein
MPYAEDSAGEDEFQEKDESEEEEAKPIEEKEPVFETEQELIDWRQNK